MHRALRLAVCAAALMATPALAQDEQPAQPEAGAATDPATQPPATETQTETPPATETEPAATEGAAATETQPAAADPAAGGDPMQALTAAAQQLQTVADQFAGAAGTTGDTATGTTATEDPAAATGDATVGAAATGAGGADMQQMQQQATQALDQLDQALQQVSGSPEGQQAQEQVTHLQQQSQQVRQQLQDDPQNAGQGLQELASAAMQIQTASIPAEADAIVGRQVVSSDGQEAGEVRDVLITADGQVEAVLLERGGALGLGGTQVAVPWDQIQIQGDQLTVNMTQDALQQMPEYQTE